MSKTAIPFPFVASDVEAPCQRRTSLDLAREERLRGGKSSRDLDQFFTRRDVAKACVVAVEKLLGGKSTNGTDWLWIEPSAGQGAFLDQLPAGSIGLDIDRRRADIAQADFLAWNPASTDRPIVVVGNPPFGKNASLARRFFNRAAEFAELVAFILPRTFEKPAFVDRLDRRMHLVCEQALRPNSFELDGMPYSVPVVFQIWEKRKGLRPLLAGALGHPDFAFVSPQEADFAFQRVGARAGLASVKGLAKSPQSHYFLKAAGSAEALLGRLRAIDWTPIKTRTAGNPSIGKAELVAAYRMRHG